MRGERKLTHYRIIWSTVQFMPLCYTIQIAIVVPLVTENREQMVLGILEQDHESLSELLQDLKSGLQQDAPRTFELLDLFWARLAVHIRAENLCLFPGILNAPRQLFRTGDSVPSFEEAKAAIESLRSDHNFFMDELATAVKTFREILASAQSPQHVTEQLETIRQRVNAVSLRLEAHNALEEVRVYKWPGLILGTAELEDLTVALRRELDNLPGRFAPV
jgi:iron-sulfur cluster repair protein YtfE (RIC family)